jgi:hypothetical protein
MARLTDRQQLGRLLDFLLGLSHPEVRALLAQRGFADTDAAEGFRLLQAAAEAFYAESAQAQAPDDPLALLDTWENRWLPIVRAALDRSFPEVSKTVLLNIKQTKGPLLAVSLQVLADRLGNLENSSIESERRAHALLVRRGLTSSVKSELSSLLDAVRHAPTETQAGPSPAHRAQARDIAWAWYLDWSQTARAVVRERRLLRCLGFGTAG